MDFVSEVQLLVEELKNTIFMNRLVIFIGFLLVGVVIFISFLNLKTILFPSDKVDSDGRIIASGINNYGQLGVQPDGDSFEKRNPSIAGDVAQMAAGRTHSLALTKNGRVWVWGGNDWSQLGLGISAIHQAKPHENSDLYDVKSISASNNHSLILKNDGSVLSFGSNFSGQLGTGDNKDRDKPTKIEGLTDITQVAAGYKFSLGLKKDGTVWGWGASCDSSTRREAEEWWKGMLASMTSIEGGYYDAGGDSMVTYDKNEYCINEDIVGILSKVPRKIEGFDNIRVVSAGYGHILGLDQDGHVWSSGCNTYKQLGRNTEKKEDNTTPQKISDLPRIVQVSAGYRHSLAMAEDGSLYGWGHNSHGQLGDGTLVDTVQPVKIPIENVTYVLSGYDFSFVLKDDGSVWGWGRNAGGWFGNSDIEYVNTPHKLVGVENITQIAAGAMFILALSK
jgi:alpha-tubulin suppressor-like RCC1 family protein